MLLFLVLLVDLKILMLVSSELLHQVSGNVLLANADGNYLWLDRPPLGNTTPPTARLIIYHLSVIYRLSCVLETS
jgi:hypothetical protein